MSFRQHFGECATVAQSKLSWSLAAVNFIAMATRNAYSIQRANFRTELIPANMADSIRDTNLFYEMI